MTAWIFVIVSLGLLVLSGFPHFTKEEEVIDENDNAYCDGADNHKRQNQVIFLLGRDDFLFANFRIPLSPDNR